MVFEYSKEFWIYYEKPCVAYQRNLVKLPRPLSFGHSSVNLANRNIFLKPQEYEIDKKRW